MNDLPASSSSSSARTSSIGSGGKYIPPFRRQTPSPDHPQTSSPDRRKTPSPGPTYTFRDNPDVLIDERLLTAQIARPVKYRDLIRIFDRYANQFNMIHINRFFSRLAEKEFIKLSRKDEPILQALQILIERNISEFDVRHTCNITWSAGKVAQNRYRFSQLLSDAFAQKRMWEAPAKVEELAMFLNGLADMKTEKPVLAREISARVSQNPELLTDSSTSLGALSLLASGLYSHQALTTPLLEAIIESFYVKGGFDKATHTEIIILLKSVVGMSFFDVNFFDKIIEDLISSRLGQGRQSLWYLVSVARSFADMRYDHPKLIDLLCDCLHPDQIGNFHDFDLPNIALVLAEISPDRFNEIAYLLKVMKERYSPLTYSRLTSENFLQASWALACTTIGEYEGVFSRAVEFLSLIHI